MEESASVELSSVADSARNVVVIVHADAALEHILSAQIEQRGFKPVVCSERAALREVDKLQPVAIVLDWDIAEIDCLDLMDSLRFGRNAKVMVCSRLEPGGEPASSSIPPPARWLRTPCTWESMSEALDGLLGR